MTGATAAIDTARTAAALERWFAASARDLPWRRDRRGYTALVSEAMLQQTQVARVLDRYDTFLRRFPTVRALAAASEQEVLAHWQGLGYYRRARSLHAAARVIASEHGGRVPRSAEALRRLPGVGRYTAGAIASIVYGRREPIVDGNVARVVARLHAHGGAPADAATVRWAWARAGDLVGSAKTPGTLNEALMELGATVCTPKTPRCRECPLAKICAARRAGLQDAIPPPKPPTPRKTVHHHAVVVRRGGRILLERRPPVGLWSDMWQTPTIEAERRLAPDAVENAIGVAVVDLEPRSEFVHQTTHRRVQFHVFTARSRARRGTWRSADDVGDLPMSNAMRRVLALACVPDPPTLAP